MLYDNAQLARVYLHAWQVTGNEFFRTIAEEILDYVVREMTWGGASATTQQMLPRQHLPDVAFYSTQDADSEGEEGKFFVWTPAEIRQVLGPEADDFMAAYSVTEGGNFEGKNILEFVGNMDQRAELTEARRKLFAAREKRVRPGHDDKVLTSWNGLMLAAFAEAARVLGRDDYRQVAEANADFILRELRQDSGRLLHTWKGGVAKQNGFLEDYSHLIEGLLELYRTTFEPRWYAAARELTETMVAHFSTTGIAGFYDTSDDHETLITRPRDLQDGAVPSGNAMVATVLLKLAGLAAEPHYAELARESLRRVQPMLAQAPLGFGQWLLALDHALAHSREVAIAGDPGADDARALLEAAAGYRPHQVVAVGTAADVPLLEGRSQLDGRATAYVCVGATCRPPVTDPARLRSQLESSGGTDE